MKKQKIARSVAIILVILLTAFMFSCGGGGSASNPGLTSVSVSIGQSGLASLANKLTGRASSAIPANVASVTILISGAGMDQIERVVNVSGRSTITETFDVPNGTNRHFLAIARDVSGNSLFQGDASADLDGSQKNITILMGFDITGDWTVTHTLQGEGQHTDFITYAQTGNSLTLSGDFVGSGTASGFDIQLNFTALNDCATVTATGTISSDGSTASGTFTATGTTEGGCQFFEGSYNGTWTMVRGHIVPQFDVTGAWSFLHTPQGQTPIGPDFFSLTQTGSTVAMQFIRGDGSVHTGSGSVSGNSFQLMFANTDSCGNPSTVTLSGTISQDGNTITGTYSVAGTSGDCVNGETGTWTSTKAQSPAFNLSGSWSGFVTPNGGTEQGPTCFTITQTGSFFTFSGDMVGSGILSGSNIMMQFSQPAGGNCEITSYLTGTVPDANSASGTFVTSNDCAIPDQSGQWRAVKGTCTPVVPQGTLAGAVTDALTGLPLSGVDVSLSQQGSVVATGTSAADGTYSLIASAAGGYSAAFSKSGYITATFDNVAINANTTTTLNASLSPVISAGQVRIVLTWGLTPEDLDSHLTGPISDSAQRFHVYYADPCYPLGTCTFDNDGNRIPGASTLALLDHDDVDSYGPETTTIVQEISGVYRFYVHDYTNGGNTASTALSSSGAKVQVYLGNSLAATYDVPTGQAGTVWRVFELSGTTLTPVNTISPDETVIQSVSRGASLKKKGNKR